MVQKMIEDGLVDKIVSGFVDMGVFVLSVAGYFYQMFVGVRLLCESPELWV
jgi:hypothetical protein